MLSLSLAGILLMALPTMWVSAMTGPAADRCSFADNPYQNEPLTRATPRVNGVLAILPAQENVATTLQGLAARAAGIVIGTPVSCKALIENDRVSTVYELSIERVLKGAGFENRRVSVKYPGGRDVGADGLVRQTRVQTFRPPQIGDRLVVFLAPAAKTPDSPGSELYGLQSGVWGSFRVSDDGKIDPSYHIGSGSNVATLSAGMPLDEFIGALKIGAR